MKVENIPLCTGMMQVPRGMAPPPQMTSSRPQLMPTPQQNTSIARQPLQPGQPLPQPPISLGTQPYSQPFITQPHSHSLEQRQAPVMLATKPPAVSSMNQPLPNLPVLASSSVASQPASQPPNLSSVEMLKPPSSAMAISSCPLPTQSSVAMATTTQVLLNSGNGQQEISIGKKPLSQMPVSSGSPSVALMEQNSQGQASTGLSTNHITSAQKTVATAGNLATSTSVMQASQVGPTKTVKPKQQIPTGSGANQAKLLTVPMATPSVASSSIEVGNVSLMTTASSVSVPPVSVVAPSTTATAAVSEISAVKVADVPGICAGGHNVMGSSNSMEIKTSPAVTVPGTVVEKPGKPSAMDTAVVMTTAVTNTPTHDKLQQVSETEKNLEKTVMAEKTAITTATSMVSSGALKPNTVSTLTATAKSQSTSEIFAESQGKSGKDITSTTKQQIVEASGQGTVTTSTSGLQAATTKSSTKLHLSAGGGAFQVRKAGLFYSLDINDLLNVLLLWKF